MTYGIIVGCDQKQEWLLTWWWSHFSAYNDLPVAFIDFGMTFHAKKWCKTHGQLISLKAPQNFVYSKDRISKELSASWEKKHGAHLWSSRNQWFYKPFALLQSPFKETIWVDLDCEILGPLSPLFNKLHRHSCMALARDNTGPFEEVGYNSGVVVFEGKSPLLSHWASSCIQKNDCFLGDQEVLTHLIHEDEIEVAELPSKYNWVVKKGINPEAIVLHWSGCWGKQVIRNHLYSES